MNFFVFVLSLFIGVYSVFGNDYEVKVKSTIKEVTVYLSGARITRTAKVNLKSGKNELVLKNLSTVIDESSIQVSGLKNANVLSINYAIDYLEKKATSNQVKILQSQKEDLLLKQDQLNNQIIGYDEELKVFEYNLRVNSDQTDLALEKLKQVSTYHRARTKVILDQKYVLKKQIKELTNKINKLTNEINKLQGQSREEQGEIKIKLDAPVTTGINLIVSYNVSKSGWFPEYDLKSNSIQTDLDIVYKANVYQQTRSQLEKCRYYIVYWRSLFGKRQTQFDA